MRCFIAVDISSTVRQELSVLITELQKKAPEVKWVAPDNLHLTLKFLGEVDEAKSVLIKETLRRLCDGQRSFTVHCVGLGTFPDKDRPEVVWVGVDEGEEALKILAEDLEEKMEGIGFKKENRSFSAHLTLGRVREGKRSKGLAQALSGASYVSSERILIDHLTWYRSVLTSKGPLYEVLEKMDFRG